MQTPTKQRTRPAPNAGATARHGRTALTVVAGGLVVIAAIVISALYGTRPAATPQPIVAAAQPDRSAETGASFDHEHQSLRVDARPVSPDASFDHEHQSLRVDVEPADADPGFDHEHQSLRATGGR